MRVLVIDDDYHIQRIVEDRLKAENFDVLKASDGIEGLRMIYDFKPDVVLLDIMMPTIDGHAVLHCIMKDDKIKNIPVLMMTAKREKADVMGAASAGAKDYIVKPIDFRQLIKKIYEAAHAVQPPEREQRGPINIRAMAEDLANLSFEMDAIAASAGVEEPKRDMPLERPGRFDISIDTLQGATIIQVKGICKPDNVETIRSEINRLIAAGVSRFILDVSDLQSLDISEVILLKDLLNVIAMNRCDRRLVETDAKRRRFLRQCNIHLDHPIVATQQEAAESF